MSDWETLPLPEALDFREGPGIMARDFRDSGVPLVRLAGLKEHRDLLHGCNYLDPDMVEARWNKFRIEPGDVLLSTSASLGEVAVADETAAGAVPYTGIIAFRPKGHKVHPLFVQFLLRAPSFKHQIEAMGVGSVMRHFGPSHLRSMTVDVPPVANQVAIAGVVGALDDKIAANELIGTTVRELLRASYEAIPRESLRTLTVGELAEVFDGPHATPRKSESGPWFLSISSLDNGRLALSESAHISDSDFERWTRRVTPQSGDVLFSYETRLGQAAIMPPGLRACLGRRMALMRPHSSDCGPMTLLYAFLSASFQDVIQQRSVHGATVDRIPLSELPSWPIVVPVGEPAAKFESTAASLNEMVHHNGVEVESLAALRDYLLPRLMSGEIRVREAEEAVAEAT